MRMSMLPTVAEYTGHRLSLALLSLFFNMADDGQAPLNVIMHRRQGPRGKGL